MGLTLKDLPLRQAVVPEGMLPLRMRVLYITTYQRTGGWLAEAFAADSAVDVVLEEAVGLAAGLARLRDEVFDAVLVSHEPGELDALELLSGLRAGGSEQPLVVLGAQSEQEFSAPCYEVGADAYVCVNTVTTRTLIWIVARAIERHRLIGENRRLSQAERQRLHREHEEAQRLLDEQRAVIRDLEVLRPSETPQETGADRANDLIARAPREDDPWQLPAQLIDHYRELLRAYVIMGSGNLSTELSVLADVLASFGVSAARTMKLHLDVLEELVRGLGSRSSRHVMTRADLLVLEVIVHLAEGYRQRFHDHTHPPRQLSLPGFDDSTHAF
jgi:DNA-binding NarL/FixJ family response regulator